MNTIRRPRKRPRKRSVSFKTLGWLIRREAMFHIVSPAPPGWAVQGSRARWSTLDTPDMERIALRLLKLFPHRRYYP